MTIPHTTYHSLYNYTRFFHILHYSQCTASRKKKTGLDRLPSSVVVVCLELAANCRRNPMRQPHIAQQSIITLLVEDQLAVSSQSRVDFAVPVEVWSKVP